MSEEVISAEESSNLVSVTGSAIAPPDIGDRKQASDMLHTRVLKLKDEMAVGYFEMGSLLWNMSQGGLWAYQTNSKTGKSYEKFEDYVEGEVDFQYRKAKQLMAVWYWFAKKIGSPKVSEKIKEIGWTKAAALVGVVDERNVDVWVDKARRLNTTKLQQECKLALEAADRKRRPTLNTNPKPGDVRSGDLGVDDLKHEPADPVKGKTGVDGTPLVNDTLPSNTLSGSSDQTRMGVDPLADDVIRETRRRWGVIVTGAQEENINAAIDSASDMAGVNKDGKGFLIDLIATHFRTFVSGAAAENERKSKANFRDDYLTKVEEYLGVNIIAILPGTNDVVYGDQTVDRIEGMKEEEGS